MTIVWILSYLCVAMFGAIAVLALAYYLIERGNRKQARNNLRSDNARNLETADLSSGNLYD